MSLGTLLLHRLGQTIMEGLSGRYKAVEISKAVYASGQLILFDLYLEAQPISIIELELRRENPLHNVAKTLMWLHESFTPQEVSFLQVFDTGFYKRHPLDRQLAIFLGQVASRCVLRNSRFIYHYFDIAIPKRFYQKEPAEQAVKELCQQVFETIKVAL